MNAHLELCLNDLLHPTEQSVSLLEALTTTQLDDIERTLTKIKQKKSKQQTQQQKSNVSSNDWALVAAHIAKALADSITTTPTSVKEEPVTTTTTIPPPSPAPTEPSTTTTTIPTTTTTTTKPSKSNTVPNHEPRTEIKDGVEWVSFVYSHHRVLRRYSIRTDVDQVDISILDDKFKNENCVYPRANIPREEYKGNRWAYETECNTLGWKLAYLNLNEIAGKRGLIQRAVDSYRNRYPSMRSRRVARQEKLLKGTLRKRKQRDSEDPEDQQPPTKKHNEESLPKTVSIDDGMGGKLRIRINIESVCLDAIDPEFRQSNCVYPRALDINPMSPFASQRQIEEAKCNELAWKLAWLNPKQLAHRKNLLQRVLDVYRSKFLPELNPRKNSLRMPPAIDTSVYETASPVNQNIMLSIPTSTDELLASGRLSVSSSGSESLESPVTEADVLVQDASSMFDLYGSIDFDPSEYIKSEQEDPLMSQLFHI